MLKFALYSDRRFTSPDGTAMAICLYSKLPLSQILTILDLLINIVFDPLEIVGPHKYINGYKGY
ncbi:hypothetical protein BABINDRAFT_154050 [Babjeviella inositovora NRRL Y-12698]|uniref:Uncharacterized protein n=1 Tax=Babjeviella inositovora NRRL Y-12698 TaxID=984486 RepID=A0A1E3QMD0_9ASCO|nr:uncharacterized protein BABINDRAFT_154050 [Babjeviella inositovora NRRL Y-12698]ODQ78856.1 hypothetical protein BABINDRAFT_154050 [Babjeviella inositovora NRRL Y-12698]